MIALMLAAVLTTDQVLKEFDDFCTKAEIEVSHPITEQMVTWKSSPLGQDSLSVIINDQFRLEYYGGRVRAFENRKESGLRKLSRLDPEEMLRWSKQPCLIDEGGARKIAKTL